MSEDEEVASVLAQVIDLGATPTQQELELGQAVMALVTERPNIRACPTCGGSGRIRTGGDG